MDILKGIRGDVEWFQPRCRPLEGKGGFALFFGGPVARRAWAQRYQGIAVLYARLRWGKEPEAPATGGAERASGLLSACWPLGRLDRRDRGGYLAGVKVRTVSFETLQRDKRRARKRDELRLTRGEVTAEQLEVENSFIPFSAKITIQDFSKTLERYYDK